MSFIVALDGWIREEVIVTSYTQAGISPPIYILSLASKCIPIINKRQYQPDSEPLRLTQYEI